MENASNNRLTKEQIEGEIRDISGWSYNSESERIERTFIRKSFLEAVAFIQRIAEVAEVHDHHPDILLSGYKNVLVMLSTHSAGGVTLKDFEMARAIQLSE